MKNLADDKFDFDDEDGFTEEELADLESLSEEELDLDFDDDFEFDDVDFDAQDWEATEAELAAEAEAEADIPPAVAGAPENSVSDGVPSASQPENAFAAEDGLSPQEQAALAAIESALDDDVEEEFSDPADGEDLPPVSGAHELATESALDRVHKTDLAAGDAFTEEGDAPVVEEGAPPVPSVEAAVAAAELEDDEYEDELPQEGDHIPVPRINISVFCESQATSDLVEAAANDRRLAKAHVNIFMGGVKKAAEHFQTENTPNLLILETVNGGADLFAGLAELAEVCDPSTKVIVIGAINDIRLYRELMDRGISDYLIAPKRPIHITRAIANLYVDPSAPPIGRSIVFVGARGGVGSSTICHNVAWAMAELHKSDTVILDLDLAFGTASLDFEQDPSQGLAEALAAPERLDDVLLDRLLQKCTDRLSLFAAPNMLDRDYDLPAESFDEVLDIVRKGVPNLVVDLPHTWTSWTRNVLQSADEIVITATPDLSSFRNAKNLIESVKAARANDAPPMLVLNQMGVPKRPEIPAEQFAEALEVEPTAIINWEPHLFGLAATNAEPVFEAGGKSKAAQSMDELAVKLLGHSGDKVGSRGLGINLKSLFRKL